MPGRSSSNALSLSTALMHACVGGRPCAGVCDVRCAMCDVRCAMCDVRCALCVVRCALCVERCALCVVRCALCVVCCVLCVVRCVLCVVCSCVVCRVLRVVCCVLCGKLYSQPLAEATATTSEAVTWRGGVGGQCGDKVATVLGPAAFPKDSLKSPEFQNP